MLYTTTWILPSLSHRSCRSLFAPEAITTTTTTTMKAPMLSSSEHADPKRVLRRRRCKRGKRAGLHARQKGRANRPPLPSPLLANVQSLDNKLDELRARILTQREIRERCALIFTETWLSDKIPACAIQLQTRSVHRGDRTAASGKAKGGGVCLSATRGVEIYRLCNSTIHLTRSF